MVLWRAGCSGTGHVRFGGRAEETDREQSRHRASVRPNAKIPTREGWLWMVTIIDCYDRDLIGWRCGETADAALCLAALADAVWERFPDQLDSLQQTGIELSHDWGSRFTSHPLSERVAHPRDR